LGTEMQSLQPCAKALIDLVLESEGHDLVHREFCSLEPRFKSSSFKTFCREYVPAKLALGCVYWVGCCAHHRIEDKELKNLFFKEVMGLFGSPNPLRKRLVLAKVFMLPTRIRSSRRSWVFWCIFFTSLGLKPS
jgi:hypothetical protein